MSRKIHIDSLDDVGRATIMGDLQIKMEGSSYTQNSQASYIYPFCVTEDYVYVPFAYGRTFSCGPFKCPEREEFGKLRCKFEGSLRTHQKEVKTEAISHLNKFGSTIIAAFPGYGKTALAIYIATKIKLKTLIVSHRIVLINQWKTSIEKFCPNATIQILTSKSVMEDCDFYIMNAANVPKHDHDFYKDIGFFIADEVHLIMAKGLSECMQRIVPRYVMGLSATPYREDGLNILLDLYFGTRKIHRKLFRKHNVYKIKTNLVPKVELAVNGRINWGVILDSQCNNKDRNDMIVRIIKFFPKRVFLVLCKRVIQGTYLVKRLQEEGEDVTSLIGKQQTFEQKSRILVGISSKVGTGFDHPRLDALILASDIQAYFIQYLGRCMRTQHGTPLIFDIVDKNPILEKHFKVRRSIYLEHGGNIQDFSKKYPDFEII
jgi:superfamily II DNA or RNA helicase